MARDLFEIYKNNPRTGDKKRIGQVNARTRAQAVAAGKRKGIIKKGSYLVISWAERTKATVITR